MSTLLRRAAREVPHHPALRWTPMWDPENRAQHRRNEAGTGTVCGITARLTLADQLDARCKSCFPGA